MRWFRRLFVFAWCAFAVGASLAEDKAESPTRSGFLLDQADLIEIELVAKDGTGQLAKRVEAPLLKYQNPLFPAQSDGLLIAWTVDSLPVALASYSIRHEREIFRELAICSERPLRCTIRDRTFWTPQPVFARRAIADDIPVPENERLRLRMMKRIAARFESGKKRVLPTPVYRYQSDSGRVIDGGLFVLTDTNDPEILIQIEAVQSEGEATASWQYSLVRMNSQPQKVYMSGDLVWELAGYWRNPKHITDPYKEARVSELPSELRRGDK